jgi:hypothetical protein
VAEAHARTGLAVKRSEITGQLGGRRQHMQTTSADTIQVVIAAALLPPTLGAQSAAISNQPFRKSRTRRFGAAQLIDDASFGPEALKAIGGSLRCGLCRDRMVFGRGTYPVLHNKRAPVLLDRCARVPESLEASRGCLARVTAARSTSSRAWRNEPKENGD